MRRGACWACVTLLFACARLPEINGGECGNGVIDPQEDCDTFGATDGSAECRPKGSVGECHLDCTPDREGLRPECPAGWGCDPAGLCREPTGEFATRAYEVGSAASLLGGDFDGDGNSDLMSLEAADRVGFTRARFHYFDEQAELRESREFSRRVYIPAVSDLSGEGRSDVIFADSRVGLLLGRADRSWVPETFSSYRLQDSSVRTLGVFDAPVQFVPGFLVFASFDGVPGVYVPDSANAGVPRLLGELPGPNEAMVGDPVGGQLIEDFATSPCLEAVLALRGEAQFWVLDTCTIDPSTGQPAWREVVRVAVALDPPELVDAAPQIADMNADGHLDVLVGAAGQLYVAYGDGTALAPAVPFRPSVLTPLGTETQGTDMPLAVGDVTGDGGADLVFDDHGLFSLPTSDPNRFDYVSSLFAEPGHWTAAAIGDLNRDGNLDLVAASTSRSGVDFFNSTGTGLLTLFRVSTPRPIQHLALGDFDGDWITDLALSQIGAASAQADTLLIAFGAPSGPPLAPTQVASLPGIEQVSVYREGGIAHMILASSETRAEQTRGVVTLLLGGGDRTPVALYELTSFAADGSTDGSGALRTIGGHFIEPRVGDVIALGAPVSSPLGEAPLEFWLLPALTVAEGTPVLLDGRMPPHLHPLSGSDFTTALRVSLRTADVDADERDEVVLATPADDGESCGLLVLGVEPDRVVTRSSFVVAEPCQASELTAFDADSDGRLDLALLAGHEGFADARLSVFWNDGAGGFDAERRSILAGPAEPPLAFAPLPATPARNTTFVYATSTQLHFATRAEESRDFAEVRGPEELVGCTGMTALDLDGDGAQDLALAIQGNVSVLKALLENL